MGIEFSADLGKQKIRAVVRHQLLLHKSPIFPAVRISVKV